MGKIIRIAIVSSMNITKNYNFRVKVMGIFTAFLSELDNICCTIFIKKNYSNISKLKNLLN